MSNDASDTQSAPPAAPAVPSDPGATQTMQAWVRAVKQKKSISAEFDRTVRPVIEQFRLPSKWRRFRNDQPD